MAQADAAGYPVVVKAQVKVGGRGKAGGIKLAADADEARRHAEAILGMDIKGHTVHRLWVEHASDIAKEYYASFTLDRPAKLPPGHALGRGRRGDRGGGGHQPRGHRPPPRRPGRRGSTRTAPGAGWTRPGWTRRPASRRPTSWSKLYACYVEGDCDLAEINPLILTTDGRVHALDAKVTLDDNAAFRHPEWEEYAATETEDPREQMAKEKGLNYIGLSGTVGIIANGAGLAMSTLDVVNQVGGSAANFLDIGGGANADVMAAALEVINADPAVRSIFVNIFGGITRVDEVAKGVVEALGRVDIALAHRAAPRRHQRRGRPGDPRPAPVGPTGGRAHHARRRPPGRGPGRPVGRPGSTAL